MPGTSLSRGPAMPMLDALGSSPTGCVACNVWRGESAFIVELAVEDWEALGKLRDSVVDFAP